MNTHVAALPPALMAEAREKAAQALFIRRHELGLSQEDVANTAGSISQRTVSELERGKYSPDKLTAGRAAALARALKWTLFDLQQATGADFGLPQSPSDLPGFPVAPYAQREEVYLPEGLLDAIKRYGEDYPDLTNPDIQRQISMARNFDGPPETPAEWLRYFIANQPWFTKDKN